MPPHSLRDQPASVLVSSVRNCTAAEVDAVNTGRALIPGECAYFVNAFETCSDSCLRALQSWQKMSPSNCLRSDSGFVEPSEWLEMCESVRADTTTEKYVPRSEPALPKCDASNQKAIDQHDSFGTAYSACKVAAQDWTDNTCSDSCLKTLEDGLDDLPSCLDLGEFSTREVHKINLVRCLHIRNESLATNVVLQNKSRSDSSATVTPNRAADSTPAATVATVAPSPTSPTSGAVSWSVPARAAVACAVLIALSLA